MQAARIYSPSLLRSAPGSLLQNILYYILTLRVGKAVTDTDFVAELVLVRFT